MFDRKDGRRVVLSHYYGRYHSGEIRLSDEYSEARWVDVRVVPFFEPKVESLPRVISELTKLERLIQEGDFVLI